MILPVILGMDSRNLVNLDGGLGREARFNQNQIANRDSSVAVAASMAMHVVNYSVDVTNIVGIVMSLHVVNVYGRRKE